MRAYARESHGEMNILWLAALIGLLLALPWTALASSVGAIEIHYAGGGAAIAGAEFSLYRAADAAADGQYVPVGAFAGCPVELKAQTAEEWRALAETLAGYAAAATADAQGATDAQGILRFEGLSCGLYLLVGAERNEGLNTWLAEPALVYVDGNAVVLEPKVEDAAGEKVDLQVIKIWKDDGNESRRPQEITVQLYRGQELADTVALGVANNWRHTWTGLTAGDWRVVETTVTDGYTVRVSHEGCEYVITNSYSAPGTSSSANKLPQTGLLWWPVSLLAISGMVLFLLGWIRYRRGEK